MQRKLRKLAVSLIYSNPVTRAILRRLALDERSLADLLTTDRIRYRIETVPEIKQSFNRLAIELGPSLQPSTLTIDAPKKEPVAKASVPSVPVGIADLSVGFDWGSRPFPLTHHAVYLGEGMGALVERWLRRQSSDANVALFSDGMILDEANAMARRFRQVKTIVPIPLDVQKGEADEALAEKVQSLRLLQAIVVPDLGTHKPLKTAPQNEMPNLTPQYNLFQGLWHAGFRQFILLSYAGAWQFQLPLHQDTFRGIHRGKQCYVIEDASALDPAKMQFLKGKITMSADPSTKPIKVLGNTLNYWVSTNQARMEEHALEYQNALDANTVKFTPFDFLPLFQSSNVCPIDENARTSCSGTTQQALQIAAFMGCSPIHVISEGTEENAQNKSRFEVTQQWATEQGIKITKWQGAN